MKTGKRDLICSLISSFDFESISTEANKISIDTDNEGYRLYKRSNHVEFYIFHEFLYGDFMKSNVVKLLFYPSGFYIPNAFLPDKIEYFALTISKQFREAIEAEKQKHIRFKSEVKNIMESWFRLFHFFQGKGIEFPCNVSEVEKFMNKLLNNQPEIYKELEETMSNQDKETDNYIRGFKKVEVKA